VQLAEISIGSDRAEVDVAILGPVEIRGAARPFQRAGALDLVVYLAMHSYPVGNEQWANALWPDRLMAPPTLHSTVSAARRSLGRARAGGDHLPHRRGSLALAPTVGSDWCRFRRAAASRDPDRWWEAVSLLRGRPFTGLRHGDWTVLEGIEADIAETVADLSVRMAEHLLAAGDGHEAAVAARKGLSACPYDERLFRILLRASDAVGNPAGVESAMSELLGLIRGDDQDFGETPRNEDVLALVHPETAALYGSLSRRARGAPGRSLTRL